MARVRSTARVTHDGEEAEAIETAPISEVMRQSGLVVTEGATKNKMLMKKRNTITLSSQQNPATRTLENLLCLRLMYP
jgi:hypothetical protein